LEKAIGVTEPFSMCERVKGACPLLKPPEKGLFWPTPESFPDGPQ